MQTKSRELMIAERKITISTPMTRTGQRYPVRARKLVSRIASDMCLRVLDSSPVSSSAPSTKKDASSVAWGDRRTERARSSILFAVAISRSLRALLRAWVPRQSLVAPSFQHFTPLFCTVILLKVVNLLGYFSSAPQPFDSLKFLPHNKRNWLLCPFTSCAQNLSP